MKVKRRDLHRLIEVYLTDDLIVETTLGEFVNTALKKALEANKVDKDTANKVQKVVTALDQIGDAGVYEKIANSAAGRKALSNAGIFASGAAKSALGVFGAFTVVNGVFMAAPKMISATIDSLNSIKGNLLNFYKQKNLMELRDNKPQKPIELEEYGNSKGATSIISKNFGINIGGRDEVITVIAASLLMKDGPNLYQEIEKLGHKKYGMKGTSTNPNYDSILAPSFVKAIGKKAKELKKAGNIRNALRKKVAEAAKSGDVDSLEGITTALANVFV